MTTYICTTYNGISISPFLYYSLYCKTKTNLHFFQSLFLLINVFAIKIRNASIMKGN